MLVGVARRLLCCASTGSRCLQERIRAYTTNGFLVVRPRNLSTQQNVLQLLPSKLYSQHCRNNINRIPAAWIHLCISSSKMGSGGSKSAKRTKGSRNRSSKAPKSAEDSVTRNTEQRGSANITTAPQSAGNNPPQQPAPAATTTTTEQQEAMTTTAEFVEAAVAKVSEFGDNEMREVSLGDYKVLLVKQNGDFHAIGNKCTHYGAPLSKGFLGNGRVRCPWHGACFSLHNGDIEEFPGLDGIPCFQVNVKEDDIVVKAEKKSLENFRRTAVVCSSSSSDPNKDSRTFILVGGGPASLSCAETLRQEGFKGQIKILSKEKELPYDRPKLSKAMHLPAADIALRPSNFYKEHNIQLLLEKEVSSVNVTDKTVNVGSEVFKYDKLLLATGSKPRQLPIPGFKLDGVSLLREPSQANLIAESATGKKVVVIGTSFIGMEVASYLSDKAASVSCIDITAVPFERVLGDRVGKMLQHMHEEKGMKFYLNSGVKEIVETDGKVTGVTLPSGETLEADMVVAGVGVVPETDFLKASGLPLSQRGELVVNEYMQAVADVFGAGDIVRFPLPLINGETSIGHWQIAHHHGRVAARNMLGKEESFSSIPYFWTVQFGKSVRYCGHALSWDEIVYEGNPEDRMFVAYYIKDDKVLAVSSLNADPAVSMAAELMYQGKMPAGSELKNNTDLKSYL